MTAKTITLEELLAEYAYRDTNTGCSRCSRDLTDDVVRCYEDGAPQQCSHCGLPFAVSVEWEMENGYDGGGE